MLFVDFNNSYTNDRLLKNVELINRSTLGYSPKTDIQFIDNEMVKYPVQSKSGLKFFKTPRSLDQLPTPDTIKRKENV